jgi:hypothetical protein
MYKPVVRNPCVFAPARSTAHPLRSGPLQWHGGELLARVHLPHVKPSRVSSSLPGDIQLSASGSDTAPQTLMYSDVGFLWPHPLLWTLQFRTVIPRSIYMKFGTHIKHANGSLNVEFGGDPRKTAGVMTPALECLSLEVGSQLLHSS